MRSARSSGPRASDFPVVYRPAVLCGLVVLGVLLPVLVVRGAALSPDSATYAAAAKSLAHGRGYLDVDGVSPMLDFPPGCSALLAVFLRVGLDVAAAGAAVDICCALATVAVLVWWARRLGCGSVTAAVLACAVVLSPPLLDSDTSVLSEAPFIALWTAAAAVLSAVVAAGRVRGRDGVLLAGLCAAAGLTRYLGVGLSVGVVLALLLVELPWRRRVLTAAAVGAGAVTPLVLWFVRNRVAGGSFVARDYAATRDTVWVHAGDDLRGVGGWLIGDAFPDLTLALGAAALAVPMLVLIVAAAPRGRRRARCSWAGRELVALSVLVVTYFAVLLVAQSRVGLDTDDRFMRPLAPSLVVLAVVLVGRAPALRAATGPGLRAAAGVAVVGLFAVHAVPVAVARIEDGQGAGLGDYDRAAWRDSPLLAALRAQHPPRTLVSNDAYAVSLLADLPVEQSPATVYDNSQVPTGQLAEFDSDVADRPRMLAWFDHPNVGLLVTLHELARTVCLQPIARFADGQLLETCGSVPKP